MLTSGDKRSNFIFRVCRSSNKRRERCLPTTSETGPLVELFLQTPTDAQTTRKQTRAAPSSPSRRSPAAKARSTRSKRWERA